MEWYNGSIQEAIKQVRDGHSYLCVLVKDDKEHSNEMLSAVSEVSRLFQGYTNLQIVYGTETCKQFAVFYPILVVPSLYIIDGNGVCLAVVADKDKIESIVTEAIQTPPATSPEQPPAPASTPSNSDISTTVTPSSINAAIEGRLNGLIERARQLAGSLEENTDNTVPPPLVGSSSVAQTSSASVQPLEERKERALQLLEETRLKEEAAAAEAEQQKERDRRELGQQVAEQKQLREGEAMKRHAESLRREKVTQKAEMEAIRAQIARDKAERKGEVYTPTAATSTTLAAPVVPEGRVRIEIKFPATESTLLRTFEDTATLSTVVEYVKEELNKENFTLWNTYPRRQYRSPDLGNTLASLGLAGSVKLLAMSGGGYSTPTPGDTAALAEQPGQASSSKANETSLSKTRIQFKKSDGSSLLHLFDKETKLVDVIRHFESQCEDLGDSVLWSLYPRYEITHEHVQKSLEELEMCPSAVIFVISTDGSRGNNQVGTGGGSAGMIWQLLLTLLQLPLTLLSYLKNVIFPARPASPPRPPPLTEEAARTPSPLQDDSRNDGLRKRTRIDGNVTRLRDSSNKPDDENNTWNGNSTELQ